MLEGVKNIFNYALTEGEKTGLAKGEKIGFAKGSAITLGVCGVLYFVPKGVKFVKKKISEKKAHDEMGEKIYAAFSEELTDSSDEGGANQNAKNYSQESYLFIHSHNQEMYVCSGLPKRTESRQ